MFFLILPPFSVNENPKTIYKKIENCNYAVNIAKRMGMHLVNIGGTDIVNRQMKLILGIVWQLMRR